MPRALHPTALKLRNFKGVAELDLALDESLTLLAGVNGVGKTSVIQALVAALTLTWEQKPPHDYPRFALPGSAARKGSSATEIVLELTGAGSSPLTARASLQTRGLEFDTPHSLRLMEHLRNLSAPLPLIVFYEQDRPGSPSSGARQVSVSSAGNRQSSLHTTLSSLNEFKAWFFENDCGARPSFANVASGYLNRTIDAT